jgi:hypothetical protein
MDMLSRFSMVRADPSRAALSNEREESLPEADLRVLQDWEFRFVAGGDDIPSWG